MKLEPRKVGEKRSPFDPGGVGQKETYYSDGSTKFTTFNSAENTRHSHTADKSGKDSKAHWVNQTTNTKRNG